MQAKDLGDLAISSQVTLGLESREQLQRNSASGKTGCAATPEACQIRVCIDYAQTSHGEGEAETFQSTNQRESQVL